MRKKRSRILIFLGGGLGFFLWFNLIVSNLDRRAIQTRKENNVFANYQHPLIPVTKNKTNFPLFLSAKVLILIKKKKNIILKRKKKKKKIYPAPTTKLTTALPV